MKIIMNYDIRYHAPEIAFITSIEHMTFSEFTNSSYYLEHELSESEIKYLIDFLQSDLNSRKKENVD